MSRTGKQATARAKAQGKGWSMPWSDALAARLTVTSRAAHAAGSGLHDDALLLFEHRRFASATALAVLADEEFSKAWVLEQCVQSRRWDSEVVKRLRFHPAKHSVGQFARDWQDWFAESYRSVMTGSGASRDVVVPTLPPKAKLDEMQRAMAGTVKASSRDALKQRALYVDFDNNGSVVSTPADVGEEEARIVLDDVDAIRAIVEASFGDGTRAIARARQADAIPEWREG